MKFKKTSKETIIYNLSNLRNIIFESTERCNLNCLYCAYSSFYQDYDNRQGKNMSFVMAKTIIDYLHNFWKNCYREGVNKDTTISFYGGEPLLNIEFIKQIIDYTESLEKVGRIYSYAMTTNGMLLDKYMDFLAEKKVIIMISLDGGKFAHSYRVDHSGKNSFTRVFRNIKQLQKKCQL